MFISSDPRIKPLPEDEDFFRLLAYNSREVVSLHTLDGGFMYASPAIELLGYENSYFEGKTIFDFINQQDLENFRNNYFNQALQGIAPKPVEFRLLKIDGSYLWVETVIQPIFDANKNVTKLHLSSRDATDRKQVEGLQARFAAVMAGTTDYVCISTLEGSVLYLNCSSREILEISADADVTGLNIFNFFTPLEREVVQNKGIAEAVRIKVWSKKSVLVSRTQKETPVSLVLTAHTDPTAPGDNIDFLAIVMRDFSKELELDESKKNFVSVTAHQLRSPLGALRWNNELMLQGDAGVIPEEAMRFVYLNYQITTRIISIIDDLLNATKLDKGIAPNNPVLTDTAGLLNEVISATSIQAKIKSVNLEVKPGSPELPKVMVDPKRFYEVMSELISNSIKYSKSGQSITVSYTIEADGLKFTVKDAGIGIPEKDAQKIFTKFFRAKNAMLSDTEGTGLGLFVVKSYVEAWGGKVWFESGEDKGSTFVFTVPRKDS